MARKKKKALFDLYFPSTPGATGRSSTPKRDPLNPRRPYGKMDLYLSPRKSSWDHNPNYPDAKELDKIEKRMDPYAFGTFLDSLIYNRMQEDVSSYKSALHDDRKGDSKKDPTYINPGQKELDDLTKRAGGPSSYAMSRFMGNLMSNQTYTDRLKREDDKYEKDKPYLLKPGETVYNETLTKPKASKLGSKSKKEPEVYVPTDEDKNHFGAKGSRWRDEETGEIIQLIKDKPYVEKTDKNGNRVYYTQGSYNDVHGIKTAYGEKQKKNKELAEERPRIKMGGDPRNPFNMLGSAVQEGLDSVGEGIQNVFTSEPADKVKEAGKEVVHRVFDEISRGLYGVQAVRQYVYDMDEEHGNGRASTKITNKDGSLNWGKANADKLGSLEKFTSGGRNWWNSIDDFELKDIGGMWKAGMEASVLKKDKDWGIKLIQKNAAEDKKKDIWDNPVVQGTGAGTSALIFDPLSYATGSGVSRIVRSADDAAHLALTGKGASNVWRASKDLEKTQIPRSALEGNAVLEKELSKLANPDGSEFLSANDIYYLAGGTRPARYGRQASKNASENVTTEFLGVVNKHIGQHGMNPKESVKVARRLGQQREFEAAYRAAQQRREALGTQIKTEVLHDELLRDAGIHLDDGTMTPEEYADLNKSLDEVGVRQRLREGEARFKKEQGLTPYRGAPEDKEAWLAESPAFDDLMEEAFKGHPHAKPEDFQGLRKDIHNELWKDDTYRETWKFASTLNHDGNRYSDVFNDLLKAKGIDKSQPPRGGWSRHKDPEVKAAYGRMKNTRAKARREYDKLERFQANMAMSTVQGRIAARLEGRKGIPIDPDRAKGITALREKFDEYAESNHAELASNVTARGDKYGGKEFVPEPLDNLDFVNNLDIDNPLDVERAFNPAFWEGTTESHFDRLEAAINYAEKKNSSKVGQINWREVKPPESLEEVVTPDFLHEVIKGDEKTFNVYRAGVEEKLGRELTPAESDYFHDLTEHINQVQGENYTRAWRNSTDGREARDIVTREGTRKSQYNRYTEALEGDVIPSRKASAEAISDFYKPIPGHDTAYGFTVQGKNGDDVFYDADHTLNAGLKDSLKKAGLPVGKRDIVKSQQLSKHLEHMDNGGVLTAHDAAEIAEVARIAGYTPPTNPNALLEWWKGLDEATETQQHIRPRGKRSSKNLAAPEEPKAVSLSGKKGSKTIRDYAISPERLRFNREFEAQNGMKLDEALARRGVATDTEGYRSISADMGPWTEKHPEGMTQAEFMAKMTGTEKELAETLYKGPFKLPIKFKIGNREYDDDFLTLVGRKPYKYNGKETKGRPEFGAYSEAEYQARKAAWDNHYKREFEKYIRDLHQHIQFNPGAIKEIEKAWTNRMRAKARADHPDKKLTWREVDEILQAEKAEIRQLGSEHYEPLSDADRAALWTDQFNKSKADVISNLDSVKALEPNGIEVPLRASRAEDFEGLVKEVERQYGKKKADELVALREERMNAPKAELEELNARIAKLAEEGTKNKAKIEEFKAKAEASREAMMTLLKDEALTTIQNTVVRRAMPGVNVKVLGSKDFNVSLPDNDSTRRAMEFMSSDKAIGLAKKFYEMSFQAPMQARNADVGLEALRMKSNTPGIIRYHLDALDKSLGKFPVKERREMLKRIGAGERIDPNESELAKGLQMAFERLRPIFNGEGPHGVKPEELRRFLPRELQLNPGSLPGSRYKDAQGKWHTRRWNTPRDMIDAFYHEARHGRHKRHDDPLNTLWEITVAVEQATAYRVMKNNLSNQVGIRRHPAFALQDRIKDAQKSGNVSSKKIADMKAEHRNLMDSMEPWEKEIAELTELRKDTNHRTINRPGWDHEFYFPEEIAKDIEKVHDMFTPEGANALGKMIDTVFGNLKIDAATRGWKTLATVYNPGYYVRNFAGEIMTGWLGGVNNPKYYRHATDMLRYMKADTDDISRGLAQHDVYKKFAASNQVDGSKKIVTLPDGRQVGIREALVLYSDQGLKTGFLNTERASAVAEGGKGMSMRFKRDGTKRAAFRAHDNIRRRGEAIEDWPRMAHFLHGLEHAPSSLKTIEQRAQYAAEQVRKYHFDYSDVSKFEQTVMARAYPFYKWTRKAMPLMVESMFLKPGKMTAYPKVMSGASAAANPENAQDTIIPEFDGMVPGFIRDLWSYKMGTDESGNDTYARFATPQLDAINQMMDPLGTMTTMSNPLFKAPMEFGMGHTFGEMEAPRDVEISPDMLTDKGNWSKVFASLNLPGGSLISKALGRKDGAFTERGHWYEPDETITGFFSGWGLYEDYNKKTDPHKPTVVGGE